MKTMNIGLLREGKIPHDKRVALTPEQCRQVKQDFPGISVYVQPSPYRCYSDQEYAAAGVELREDISFCDVLFGIKEVPVSHLIAHKTYFFFSHTIKKQSHNRKLLKAILQQHITLVDYECLTDLKEDRLVAFGRYAGIVGAYNALITWGKKTGAFDLKPAHKCFDFREMQAEFAKVKLPAIKIVVTGAGRVGNGAREVLDGAGIRQVSPAELLQQAFSEPVYAMLRSADYHQPKDGGAWQNERFYEHPEQFGSDFKKYTEKADMLIAGAYWHPHAPKLFSPEEMKQKSFRIKVIADITCDIDGSIPSTQRASSISEPFYDYEPQSGALAAPFSGENNITVMAVDNLPCELPRDASASFGQQLITHVFHRLAGHDPENVIGRATIARDGKLTEDYAYLSDFVDGE